MGIDHREIIDKIEEVNALLREKHEKGPFLEPPPSYEVLGLTFRPGEEVVDKVTGQKGVILDGGKARIALQRAGSR